MMVVMHEQPKEPCNSKPLLLKGRSFKNGLLPKNPKLEAGVAMSSIFKKQNLTAS